MIRLKLPPVFGRFTEQLVYDLPVEGGEVRGVIASFRDAAPSVAARLFDNAGAFRDDLFRIGLNGAMATLETPVRAGDEIRLVAATSGGAPQGQLPDEAVRRYARQITLPGMGRAGQARLCAARVLMVGAGGLGCPASLYLAAAGVGRLTLVDPDVVELSNLQRQVLYTVEDVGSPKVAAAAARLSALNPLVEIVAHPVALSPDNVDALVADHDLVVDGTDSVAIRHLVNQACRRAGKPWIFGSVYQFEGQVSVFLPDEGAPCYACLYPEEPDADFAPNCAAGGVLGVLPGVVGTLQAVEALKLLAGIGEPLSGQLLLLDLAGQDIDRLRFSPRPDCPVCGPAGGTRPRLREASANQEAVAPAVSPREAERWIGEPETVFLDVREPGEIEVTAIPGAVNLPLPRLAERLAELDPLGRYVVICRGGPRSERAAALMKAQGFDDVVWVSGGLIAWNRELDAGLLIA